MGRWGDEGIRLSAYQGVDIRISGDQDVGYGRRGPAAGGLIGGRGAIRRGGFDKSPLRLQCDRESKGKHRKCTGQL